MRTTTSTRVPAASAAREARRRIAGALLALGVAAAPLLGCGGAAKPDLATLSAAQAEASGVPVPPKDALPLDEAVLRLADATLGWARLSPPPPGTRYPLVIDPLIDRATGAETGATRAMVARIEALVRERYPHFELRPFATTSLDARPLVLLGAITPVAAPGSLTNAAGPTDTYRIWAVLGDLRTGRILTHPTAWVSGATVDATPTAFFRDSPAWTTDEAKDAYLRTCAGNPGDPIDPVYLRNLRAQALIADAVRDQEAGRHRQALARFQQAAALPGGDQLRALNGVYLASRALGRAAEAEAAFGRLVDQGLARDRLAVKFLFRPGSTEFLWPGGAGGSPYPMWLRQVARGAEQRRACLRVSGHASPTGPAAANERLSLARAERVRGLLAAERPALRALTRAEGRGAREPIVGSGRDDLSDALDRRVEFAPLACPEVTAWRPGGAGASDG